MEDRKVLHIETEGEITQEEVKGIVERFQAAEVPSAVNADKEVAQGAPAVAPVAVEVPHADDTGDNVIPAEVPRAARGENTTINHIDELAFYEAKTAGNTDLDGVQGVAGHQGESGIRADEEGTTSTEPEARLGFGEQWIDTREGNNKKWRAPSKEKRRKQMAKASQRRNRRA